MGIFASTSFTSFRNESTSDWALAALCVASAEYQNYNIMTDYHRDYRRARFPGFAEGGAARFAGFDAALAAARRFPSASYGVSIDAGSCRLTATLLRFARAGAGAGGRANFLNAGGADGFFAAFRAASRRASSFAFFAAASWRFFATSAS